MKFKVCGLFDYKNIQQVAELNPDYIGHIFWEKSVRFVKTKTPDLKSEIKKTGVFFNSNFNAVIDKVLEHDLACGQLHGDESPDFCKKILLRGISMKYILVGKNFKFGNKRSGDYKFLLNFGKENQFYVNPVKLLKTPNHLFNKTKMKIYSSTNIRKLISNGNVKLAKNFLGNNFSITSKVIKGDQRGRKIGVPTANLNINEYVAPKYGVYAIEASFLKNSKKRTLKGIANFGIRPTFHKNTEILEVHLFRFKLNIYNSLLKVDFVEFIRHEKKFSGVEALKKQLKSDISKAQKILN